VDQMQIDDIRVAITEGIRDGIRDGFATIADELRYERQQGGNHAMSEKAEAAEAARGGDMDTNQIRHKQIAAKLDRILARPVGKNDVKLDRILAIVKEETGCANEVIAKLDRLLEILGSPQEFSMNFRLTPEPPKQIVSLEDNDD